MVLLEAVLEVEDVARVRRELEGAHWRDGRLTAGAAARAVKANLQAAPMEGLATFVREALTSHPMFEIAARPRRITRPMFSRYEPGMTYGEHTDDALMGEGEARLRTDLAFTLFLADPDSYEGGALRIAGPSGDTAIKLKAGDAVLYGAGTIHAVEPVTAGVRLAAVGWVQSAVRDAAQREALFDLSVTRARLAGAAREDLLRLDKTISNLLRMWAEV
ncbi:MAG: Fe2+-dependent dioxygenase [Hyphomonadaceae bacterium]|nr:Fe2+-dependent dioxygenase [Hyphomonadaceae bacterium]